MDAGKKRCIICSYNSSSHVSYFSFTKELNIFSAWLKYCEIYEEVLPTSRLCSLHFSNNLVKMVKNKRLLNNKNAIPTVPENHFMIDNDHNYIKVTNTNFPSSSNTTSNSDNHCTQFCTACKKSSIGISHFSFPDKLEIRTLWVEFCNMKVNDVKTTSKLCMQHFKEEDLIQRKGRYVLKSNSVPSIKTPEMISVVTEPEPELVSLNFNTVPKKCYLCGSETVFYEMINFQFSKDSQLRNVLENFFSIIIEDNCENNQVCVRHFCENDFINGRTLKEGAVPILFLKDTYNNKSQNITKPVSNVTLLQDHVSTIIQRTPVNRKRSICFIDDITTPDFATPKRARKSLSLVRQLHVQQTKNVKCLVERNRRVNQKLKEVQGILLNMENKKLIGKNLMDSVTSFSENLVGHDSA